jgi:hypothetical protein
MSPEVAVRFVFAIGSMSASDGNGRCDWIDFRDALRDCGQARPINHVLGGADYDVIERKAAAGTTKYAPSYSQRVDNDFEAKRRDGRFAERLGFGVSSAAP